MSPLTLATDPAMLDDCGKLRKSGNSVEPEGEGGRERERDKERQRKQHGQIETKASVV